MANVCADLAARYQIKAGGIAQLAQPKRAYVWQAFCPDGQPCGKPDQPIHEVRFDQSGGKGAAAFAKHAGQAVRAQLLQNIVRIKLAALRRTRQQMRPKFTPGLLPHRFRIPSMT